MQAVIEVRIDTFPLRVMVVRPPPFPFPHSVAPGAVRCLGFGWHTPHCPAVGIPPACCPLKSEDLSFPTPPGPLPFPPPIPLSHPPMLFSPPLCLLPTTPLQSEHHAREAMQQQLLDLLEEGVLGNGARRAFCSCAPE